MEEEKLRKRKQRAKKDGNMRQLSNIVKDLGDLYFQSGKFNDALDEYTEQLNICEILNDKLNWAVAHRMIGEIHTNSGNYKEALTHQIKYLEGVKELDDLVEQQRAFATLGRTHFCLGEAYEEPSIERTEALAAAKKAYTKSLKLCDKLEHSNLSRVEIMMMRARLLLNLGLVLDAQKSPEQAIDLIERAAELCEKHKLNQDLHRTHLALGALYERQQNYNEALRHYNLSTRVTDDSVDIATGQISEVELLAKMGRYSDARKILVKMYVDKKAPSLADNVVKLLKIVATIDNGERNLITEEDNERRMKLYELMGDAAVDLGSYEKAVEYYLGMLNCAEKDPASHPTKISAALVSLAQTLKDEKRYDEALVYARRELDLCANDNREMCRSALFLADLLTCTEQSPDWEVRDLYAKALASAVQCNDKSLQIIVMKDMRVYFCESGALSEAEELDNKIDALKKTMLIDDDSSRESSQAVETSIDIDLDELSDVERELQNKNEKSKGSHSRTTARNDKLVVKRNEKGETKLHVACINNNIQEVENLLAAGHPVNVRDNCGWTPLHEAANYGHLEIAKLLINAGANVNDPGGTQCGNITPLHDAASCGHCSMINLLIEHGADIRLKTKTGESVLDCLECWRYRLEEQRRKEFIEWTIEDEETYKLTRDKLRMILPPKQHKSPIMPSNKSSLIDDDEEDNIYGHPSETKIMIDDDKVSSKEKISAGEDYKRTIERLKGRGKNITSMKTKQSSSNKNIAPLIDSEQQLIGDWLEDDIGILDTSNTSRRSSADNFENLSGKRKSFYSSSSTTTPENERIIKRPKRQSDGKLPKSPTALSCEENSSNDSENFELFNKSKKNQLRQTSLLQISGFSKNVLSRTPSPTIFSFANGVNDGQRRISNFESTQFKIMLEDKIININLKLSSDNDIYRRLINEIVEQFQRDTGCKPKVTLSTINGEVLSPENFLNLLYANQSDNFQLNARLIDLEIPPITERYEIISTACNKNSNNEDECIKKALKACEHAEIFKLKSDDEILNIGPLLRSLEYEKNLKILNLSGCSLYNFGKILNCTLIHLLHLQELYLLGCDIDSDCLLQIDNFPSQLRVLDMSYNPLGVESQSKLRELLTALRYLHILNLRCCQLTRISSATLSSSTNIDHLDLAWNVLDDNEIDGFLQKQLINLNLSNTNCKSIMLSEPTPIAFLTLETLELTGCNISDTDIINLLSKCHNLSQLVAGDNPNVTQIAVEALLERKPTLTLIDTMGCSKITEIPRSQLVIDNPSVCTMKTTMQSNISTFWESLWQGYARHYQMPFGIIVFKPIV